MSNAVSALDREINDAGIVQIREIGLQGMITVRGELGSAAMRAAIGQDLPSTLRIEGDVAWMSPDELLVLCPYADVSARIAAMQKHLAGAHALVVDVSDARVMIEVTGAHVRDVLAKLAPVNLSAGAMLEGTIRRSRLAQIPAAFWFSGPDRAHIIAFRSQARYLFDLLSVAAQPGSEMSGHAME